MCSRKVTAGRIGERAGGLKLAGLQGSDDILRGMRVGESADQQE
jgi:hypothetical protein